MVWPQASLVSLVAIGEVIVRLLGAMDVSLAAIAGFAGVIARKRERYARRGDDWAIEC